MRERCPLCGSMKHTVLGMIEYDSIKLNNLQGVGVNICCCNVCKFVYKDLDVKLSSNHYETFVPEENESFYNDQTELLAKYIKAKSFVLDIGCNDGGLLAVLAEKYIDATFAGLEILDKCCEKSGERGISIMNGSIYDKIREFNGKFDIIIISQVLEHLPDIRAAIKNSLKWLKEDGIFLITVPDDGNQLTHKENITSLLSLEHINHFSRLTLNRLLISEGLELIEQIKKKYYFYSTFGIYKKSIDFTPREIQLSIDEYGKEKDILKKNFKKRTVRKSYVIWGASHMALNLIGDVIDVENLRFIVDRNPQKQERLWGGIEVKNPSELFKYPEYGVLILPNSTRKDIIKMIKNMNIKNEIICL